MAELVRRLALAPVRDCNYLPAPRLYTRDLLVQFELSPVAHPGISL
jgi:hypothetical protein